MGQLFGTDGVRGIANVEPMTSEIALRLGRALAHVAKQSNRRHKILIGKDTRLSGYMLETAMASGICSMGVDVLLVGPLPTPGIAFLTRTLRADAGVVISASHNAFQDNGIKFFSPTGFKLADELEAEIERLVLSDSIDALRPTATEIGKAFRIDDAVGRYNVFAKSAFPRYLTLDGDADRAICVDERGEVVDGDEMMAMLAAELHAHGELRQGTVVATVMSNLGFHVAMRERSIRVVSTPVGDRSVVEEMVRGGYNLGGEQSGHIVFLDHNTTGDGLITSLAVLALLVEKGRPLSELRRVMGRFPQVLLNVPVTAKPDVESVPRLAAAVARAEAALGDSGRVLVRYSGTEPLLRIMVEGEREAQIQDLAQAIATAASDALSGAAAAVGEG